MGVQNRAIRRRNAISTCSSVGAIGAFALTFTLGLLYLPGETVDQKTYGRPIIAGVTGLIASIVVGCCCGMLGDRLYRYAQDEDEVAPETPPALDLPDDDDEEINDDDEITSSPYQIQ